MGRYPVYLVTVTLVVGLTLVLTPDRSAFANQGQSGQQASASTDTSKARKASFLDTWKQIQGTVTKKRATRVAQGTETAGVRGKEAEDQIIDQMYYRGGTAYPTRSKISGIILELTQMVEESDAADPASTAEYRFYIGQCYAELGETDKAIASFDNVIKVAPKTTWADQARAEKKRLTGK